MKLPSALSISLLWIDILIFWGVNGQNDLYHTCMEETANIRFGFVSSVCHYTPKNTLIKPITPQVGIGFYYTSKTCWSMGNRAASTGWLDADFIFYQLGNYCGTDGNGLGVSKEDAGSKLWVR